MLQRRERSCFLAVRHPAVWNGTSRDAALREVKKPVIDILAEGLRLTDCQRTVPIPFSAFPSPVCTGRDALIRNTGLCYAYPRRKRFPLTEHLAYGGLPAADAAAKTISPVAGSN